MKKAIALAVAGAFVAPVYAADVTVKGDIEYILTDDSAAKGELGNSYDGDTDLAVVASEELDNGMTVTLTMTLEDIEANIKDGDTELAISGDFGTVSMGQIDPAAALYDEGASVAEAGGGWSDLATVDSGQMGLSMQFPAMNGLSVAASVDFDNADDSFTATAITGDEVTTKQSAGNLTENLMHTSVAVSYTTGGINLFYGAYNVEAETGETTETNDTSVYGASFTSGPFYVAFATQQDGYDSKGKIVGAQGKGKYYDTTTLGATYSYGPGKLFVEKNEAEIAGGNVKPESTIYGVSYKLGGAVNLYLQADNRNKDYTAAADAAQDVTSFGVEYAF